VLDAKEIQEVNVKAKLWYHQTFLELILDADVLIFCLLTHQLKSSVS
jgi:hypothetical protein